MAFTSLEKSTPGKKDNSSLGKLAPEIPHLYRIARL